MVNVKRILLALLFIATAQAADPEQAASIWEEENGTDLVQAATFPTAIAEGSQFSATLHLNDSVEDVKYQICNIGQVCWVSNVPLERSGNNWTLHTADIPAHQPDVRAEPIHFEEGNRVGVQFFLTIDGETVLFPHGEECDVYAEDSVWIACQETHYFSVPTTAAEKSAPAPAIALLLGLLWVMRRE